MIVKRNGVERDIDVTFNQLQLFANGEDAEKVFSNLSKEDIEFIESENDEGK